jgi:hypothetical protein
MGYTSFDMASKKNGNMVQAIMIRRFLHFLNTPKVVVLIIFGGGDINNDGSGTNDLIYIPTTAEISTMNFFTGGPAQGVALMNLSIKIVI